MRPVDYEEIKLGKVKEVSVFSVCFLSFFDGELITTTKFFGKTKIKAQQVKYRYQWFDDGNSYQWYWSEWNKKYIKI